MGTSYEPYVRIEAPKILQGRTVRGPVTARMTIDDREYVNFFGAGYLALSAVPEIREAVLHAFQEGAPFAQHLPAAHGAIDPIFDQVERAGAAACNAEACLYFASGYMIGAVGLASLEQQYDLILVDESAHYSLIDAAKLSGRPYYVFAHCDPGSLGEGLKRHVRPKERPLVITDGAFATTGRIPPLADYAALLADFDGRLFIDESHAFGVVGESGRGAAQYCGVENVTSIGATLSKAFCAHGALVCSSPGTIAGLRAKPPIGAANAGSPLSAVAATASLRYVSNHPELRVQLRATTDYLRNRLRGIGLTIIDSPASIVSFKWGSRMDMVALQHRAFERGIYIHHSNYVGAGPEGVIRCAVFRDHSREDIDALVDALG